MTVRGFLVWYLGTVALVGGVGATTWHGIQMRRHVETAGVVGPPLALPVAPEPAVVADVKPQQPLAEPAPRAAPVRQQKSQTASLPVPPLRAAPPATRATHVAGVVHTMKPRVIAKATVPAPGYPPTPHPQPPPYPGYASGYAVAYPPVAVAPWQMQPYQAYYPYRRYYMRSPYYSAY